MFDFYEQRKIKHILYSWPSLIVLLLLLIVLSRASWGAFVQERETYAVKAERLQYLEELTERELSIKNELDRLNTERGIEAEIRQKFEVAREGEQMVVIVDAPPTEGLGDNAHAQSFWKRISTFLRFW